MEDLCRRRPPEGETVPILVQLAMTMDGTLEGGEMTVALRILHTGRAGGPSGMREEHLKVCLREATQKRTHTKDGGTNWLV